MLEQRESARSSSKSATMSPLEDPAKHTLNGDKREQKLPLVSSVLSPGLQLGLMAGRLLLALFARVFAELLEITGFKRGIDCRPQKEEERLSSMRAARWVLLVCKFGALAGRANKRFVTPKPVNKHTQIHVLTRRARGNLAQNLAHSRSQASQANQSNHSHHHHQQTTSGPQATRAQRVPPVRMCKF